MGGEQNTGQLLNSVASLEPRVCCKRYLERDKGETKCAFMLSRKTLLLWAGSSPAFQVTPQIAEGHFVVLCGDMVRKDSGRR